MTTITRKRNLAPIILSVFLILAGTQAQAEDAVDAQAQKSPEQQQQAQNPQAFDQQYKLPPNYKGKYYPNDDPAIGYHGTSNKAQNDSGQNGSYYYYYY